jgi:predicted transcriptional regulator
VNRPKIHIVSSIAAWNTLSAPVRTEIAEALRLQGPCSIADIARTLDRPADSLYRHFKALCKVGIVIEVGLRKKGRNAEQIFDLIADDVAPDFSKSSVIQANKAIYHSSKSLLGAMSRTIRDTANANGFSIKKHTRNVSINYELSWLTEKDFARVRKLITEIKAIMDECKTKRKGRLFMTLAMISPVTRKRGSTQPHARAARKNKPANRNR